MSEQVLIFGTMITSTVFDAVKPVFEALCKGAEANPDEIDDDEVLCCCPLCSSARCISFGHPSGWGGRHRLAMFSK